MSVRFGEQIQRDPRRYDQRKLKPGEAQQISDLLKVDLNQLRNRGFHASYLMLLAIALQEHSELELRAQQESK